MLHVENSPLDCQVDADSKSFLCTAKSIKATTSSFNAWRSLQEEHGSAFLVCAFLSQED
jgi:hypothetical protein